MEQPTPLLADALPTPRLKDIAAERREVRFVSGDVELAGELDLPPGAGPHPLAFIIHHSGPVPRDSYGYLAEILLRAGYAVFRFDKRGTGASGGVYGCCEGDDALAAYRAAVAQPGIDRCRIFIIAQSIGTQHLATRFEEYALAQAPLGVALLSSLLHARDIVRIQAPIIVIVADSEPELNAIGPEAVAAHNARYGLVSTLYVAEGAEHTLFDIRDGPIDWTDPRWVERYHRGAMEALVQQLDAWRVARAPGSC
ncbi:MAG: lysophospholipase [Roseiflexus sp.]|nr:lysophospholipase [Roseiflexus sp.]MCS7291125.1 lysophospholipase [Roseiflexus sp.]MDW8145871.1 alpha/beta hydrolase [Roseiflexaceae bacterium]MDW8232068.1 alpha/beta hydrolase [Roseiflexaceae bacterium]